MPKVIYANDDDDRNYVKDALEMAKLGASVAGSIQGIEANKQAAELNKVQADKTKAEFSEWNSRKELRDTQANADLETAKTTASTQFDKRRIMAGTAAAQQEELLFGPNADKTIPLNVSVTSYSDTLNKLSGGDITIQSTPVTLEDGTQINQARYVTKSGESLGEFNYSNNEDFRKGAASTRQRYGFISQDVIANHEHIQKRVEAFRQLPADARALVGNDPNRMDENPDVAYMVENMIGGKKSHAEYSDDRDTQKMKVTEHKDRMATNATNRAYYNEQREIAAEERDYKIKQVRPYEEEARRAQAEQNEAKLMEVTGKAAEEYWPELQPTYQTVSTPGADSTDPSLAALGVSGAQQKKTYTPEQQDALRFLQGNINQLPQDMPLHQKFDVLRDMYVDSRKQAGVKSTVFYTEEPDSKDGEGDESKNRESQPPRSATDQEALGAMKAIEFNKDPYKYTMRHGFGVGKR